MSRYRIPLAISAVSGVAIGVCQLAPEPWSQLKWYAIVGLFGGVLAGLIQLAATPAAERSRLGWLRWLEAGRYTAPVMLIALALIVMGVSTALLKEWLFNPFFWIGLVYLVVGQAVWLIRLGPLPAAASLDARAWRVLIRGLIAGPTVLFAVYVGILIATTDAWP